MIEGEQIIMWMIMLANMIIMTAYSACVTYAAIHFDNPRILCWYLLLVGLGFTYKTKE